MVQACRSGLAAPTPATPAPARTLGGPVVVTDHVSFCYRARPAVIEDMSFELQPGEIVSVIGPSGCGKSTLLRLLSGLTIPTRGRVVRRFGRSDRHGCSMVFQEETLLPWLRVRENVGLYYRFKHQRDRASRSHVLELLDMVGMTEFAGFYPSQLSGGMKRRVAMLMAITAMPELLLLDEPFSALDEPTRIGIHQDLHNLIRQFDICTVIVTHDLGEAITMSDRILQLSPAPATIVEEHLVPFGRTRQIAPLRADSDYLAMYGRLWEALFAHTGVRHADRKDRT